MGKQAGVYGAEDQSITPVPVPICSHLTRNHRRQPVTLAPITLMAWDSLLLALAPWHTLGTRAALPRVSQKAAGRPVAVGAGWEKVSCLLLAAAAPQFQGGFPPPAQLISLLMSPHGGQNHMLPWVLILQNTESPSALQPPK